MQTFVIYTALFGLLGGLCICRECTKVVIDECLEPMSSFDTEINSAVVVYLEEDVLREHCRLYEIYSNCMADVRPECGKVDRLVFEGIDDSYHYLCDEAFDEYLEHRECFKNPDLHEEGSACNHTLSTKLDDLDHNRSASFLRDRICQYAEDYLDCVQNAVASFCGKAAAKWQRGLDERSLWPLLNEINCPTFSTYTPWWKDDGPNVFVYIVIGVLIFISLVIMVLAFLMIRVYRKKKAIREARAARRAASNQSQGPYVSYGNGNAVVHGVSGAQAGPIPEKGMMPPPYTTANPGGDGILPPDIGGAGLNFPPAYSDITGVKGSVNEGYDNPVAVDGESFPNNPMYDNPNPMYDNNRLAHSQAGTVRSDRH